MIESLSVSVVVPTIGRVELLRRCLDSLALCDPAPDEIIVADQSSDSEVRDLAAQAGSPPVRVLACDRRGIAANMNLGLRAAANDAVLVTHDDCTVAPDWVATGMRHLASAAEDALITGRVLPVGPRRMVPSVKTDPSPRDFAGVQHFGKLYPNNMALSRGAALALGGFDERPGFWRAAEDHDFGYRWLRAGHRLHYRPDMVVWHHDWRSAEDLAATYRTYARAAGVFYAKHVAAGDVRLLAWAARRVLGGVRATVRGLVDRQPTWSNERRALVTGLPLGFLAGLREARALRRR